MIGRFVIFLVRLYQWTLSPFFKGACRFQPSCSEYFIQAVSLHGLWRGVRLGVGRLFRCHPFGPSGLDPVPPPSSTPGRTL